MTTRTRASTAALAAALAFQPLSAAGQESKTNDKARATEAEVVADPPTREVSFISSDGADIGTALLTGTPAGLLIRLDLHDLPSGAWLGFHIHEAGTCDPADGFKSAGGHWTTGNETHGFESPDGPHDGDMPNQHVAADGTLRAEVLDSRAGLGDMDHSIDGRALVLHGGADDYTSQPSGDSGARIACAVVE